MQSANIYTCEMEKVPCHKTVLVIYPNFVLFNVLQRTSALSNGMEFAASCNVTWVVISHPGLIAHRCLC